MKKLRLNINGQEVTGMPGQTILDVAKENDIYIPTLCFDDRLEIYGSCGICVVEVEGMPKMVKACATEIAPNMVIKTETERVFESRKTNLELLLSNHVGDCRPPCLTACPAETDCQGYVGLIANGEYEEAVKLIKERIPLPGALGRVCPHPCEDACRRGLVDEPISIAWMKRFAADHDMFSEDMFIPEVAEETGKRIAVVGGGPGGISAAFFLRQKGHDITIFEAMPHFGGMLRYGIPEYRLPKDLIDEEVSVLEKMGVELVPNTKIGRDMTLESLNEEYDAVFVAIGAWKSTDIGCPGEDAKGVFGGIEFLGKFTRNEAVLMGDKVAVVGGGNTAMDACRTAVRLGASKVYNVYRRTKAEMPADEIEIIEADEEGVIFKNLTNPIEIIKDENGNVKSMRLQKMQLGEPDASGRRRPEPIPGEEETIELDTVIVAIGQAVDPTGLDALEKTKWNGIITDRDTFRTSVDGIFAGGDCFNDEITIAVEAIGHAKKAAEIIDAYVFGEEVSYVKPYIVTRDDVTEEMLEDREKMFKSHMAHLSPEDRKDNFLEVVAGFTPEEAEREGKRCLECGCMDYFECKLIELANEYDVKPERFAGEINKIEFEDDHPFIKRDPNKCILCGLCVRVCDEVVGVSALGLVDRGFDAVVQPALTEPLMDSGCVSCGQCISVCPTGALNERLYIEKPVPVDSDQTETTCSFCSVGCGLVVESIGNTLLKALPDKDAPVNKGVVCGKGRFGFDVCCGEDAIDVPMIKKNGEFIPASYYDAFVYAAKGVQSRVLKYGEDSVAVSISDAYTNEDAYSILKLADSINADALCFNHRESGLLKVLGDDASPNTIEELLSTEVIIGMGYNLVDSPVVFMKMMEGQKNGAKLIMVNPAGETPDKKQVDKTYQTANDITFLKEVAKALIESGKKPANADGFEAFKTSLENVTISDEARELAEIYGNAKKAMIVFGQNFASVEAATLIANIAVISGHIGKPRAGILQVKSKNNSQGLIDLGVSAGAEAIAGKKALMIFGEDPDVDLSHIEFLVVQDGYMTETAKQADVIFPRKCAMATEGTYTNTERRLQEVIPAVESEVLFANWEVAAGIASILGNDMPYESVQDIGNEMMDVLPIYKFSDYEEILGGVLYEDGFDSENGKATLTVVESGDFINPLRNTDIMMRKITEKLPKPAPQFK